MKNLLGGCAMKERCSISKQVVHGLLDYFNQELASMKCPLPGTTAYWGGVLELLGAIISLDDPELNRSVEEFLKRWIEDKRVRYYGSLWHELKDMYVAKLKHLFFSQGLTPWLEEHIVKWFYRFLAAEKFDDMVEALELFKKCKQIQREDLKKRVWEAVLDYIDGASVDRLIIWFLAILRNMDPTEERFNYVVEDLPF